MDELVKEIRLLRADLLLMQANRIGEFSDADYTNYLLGVMRALNSNIKDTAAQKDKDES